jgi:hypothetical protein
MKIYPSELTWREKLKGIPKAQHEREFQKMNDLFYKQGFKVVDDGVDRHGHFVEVAIRPGTKIQAVNQLLEDYAASAVTVRPEDIEPILGRSIVTLGMRRKLEYDGDHSVSMLEPSELVDALDALRGQAQFPGGPLPTEEVEQFIVDDLVSQGYISERDAASMDAWLNPVPEPLGLKGVGRRDGITDAFEVGRDGEDWAPDTSVDEWADQ